VPGNREQLTAQRRKEKRREEKNKLTLNPSLYPKGRRIER
jgi:hypothetical protein